MWWGIAGRLGPNPSSAADSHTGFSWGIEKWVVVVPTHIIPICLIPTDSTGKIEELKTLAHPVPHQSMFHVGKWVFRSSYVLESKLLVSPLRSPMKLLPIILKEF